MTFRFYLIVFVLSFLQICNSFSQLAIGIRLAIGQSNFVDQKRPNSFEQLITYSAGIGFESTISEAIDFRTEFNFDQRGSRNNLYDQKIIKNYLNAYLGPKINIFSQSNSLVGGVYAGYLLNKYTHVKGTSNSSYEFREFDGGIWAGIRHDVNFWMGRLSLDFKFIQGLINIDNINTTRFPLSSNSKWTRNQSFQIGLGIAIYDRI